MDVDLNETSGNYFTFSIVSLFFQLPSNYNFEIPKTIWKIRTAKSKCGRFVSFLSLEYSISLVTSMAFAVNI